MKTENMDKAAELINRHRILNDEIGTLTNILKRFPELDDSEWVEIGCAEIRITREDILALRRNRAEALDDVEKEIEEL